MPIRWVERDHLRPYVPPPEPPERTVEQLAAIYRIRTLQKVRKGAPSLGRRGRRPAERPPTVPIPAPPPPPPPSASSAEPPSRHPAVLAAEILTSSVVTAAPDDPVAVPLGLFERRGFRHLPVVAQGGALVGILSERDLLRSRELPAGSPPRRVRDLMTFPVLTASLDTPIRELARAMAAERISCLPIVDEKGALAGIVTTTDILKCVASPRPLNLWA